MQLYSEQSPEFVKTINTIYHNVEAEFYDARHSEIFYHERTLLCNLAERLGRINHAKSEILCLDVGTGTANIPRIFHPVFTEMGIQSRWILSDISVKMLQVASENLSKSDCSIVGSVLLDAETPSFLNGQVDLITANSVLHHLPNPEIFIERCCGLLKEGGVLVISQEPKLGYYNSYVWNLASFLRFPIRAMNKLQRGKNFRQKKMDDDIFWQRIESALTKQGITGLSRKTIVGLVDIQSPTAKENIDPNRGFEISKLFSSDWEIINTSTYAHLGKLAIKFEPPNIWLSLDDLLGNIIPDGGSLFWVLARKKSSGEKK